MFAKPLVGLLQLKEEVGDQDCDHEYGWDDLEKLSPVVRAFKSFEDRIILPLFTKDHKTMKLADNEVMESEEEGIFDRLEEKHNKKIKK